MGSTEQIPTRYNFSLALFCWDVSRLYLGCDAVDSRQCPAIGSKVIGSVLGPVVAIKSVSKHSRSASRRLIAKITYAAQSNCVPFAIRTMSSVDGKRSSGSVPL
jgi:hypothetical protein